MKYDVAITDCIKMLQDGDRNEAARLLWESYFPRLVGLARARLEHVPRRMIDEEDIAISAFQSFCNRAERGMFPRLNDRDDLWQLLFVITVRKAIDAINYQARPKRDFRKSQSFSDLTHLDLETLLGRHPEPSPDLAYQLSEQYQRLLSMLDDEYKLRTVAVWKMEGHTNEEIAKKLGCVSQTVERKLRSIRLKWSKEQTVEQESAT